VRRFSRAGSSGRNDRPPRKWEIDHAIRLGWLIGIAMFGINCGAQAQGSGKACDIACLQQKVDDLEKKLDALTAQVSKSVKSGQNVTLHTQNGRPGGCLTYRGLSGEQGGLVSWNANCSRDVLWTIN
jgi:hypothetical protein